MAAIHIRNALRLIPLLLIAVSIRGGLQAQSYSLEHDGLTRGYLLYVPESLQSLAPLVVALHGGSGTAANFRAESGFDALADEQGFIVVYPEGVNREWNERRGGGMTVRRSDADDVGFIDTLLDTLLAEYPIDPTRIYAAGMSNGGFMALRLACDISDRFAGIGVVAAQLTEEMAAECNAVNPMRVVIINGTDDPLLPYDGGEVNISGQYRGEIAGTAFTVDAWLVWNECDPPAAVSPILNAYPDDDTSVEITEWHNCARGAAAKLYRVVGGGHTYPVEAQYAPHALFGRVSQEIFATTELWDFWTGGEATAASG